MILPELNSDSSYGIGTVVVVFDCLGRPEQVSEQHRAERKCDISAVFDTTGSFHAGQKMTVVRDSQKQPKAEFLVESESTRIQQMTEFECKPYFSDFSELPESQLEHLRECGLLPKSNDESQPLNVCLIRERHIEYLEKIWTCRSRPALPASFVSLDSSRTWMIYWTLHSCDLMGHEPEEADCMSIIDTIEQCFTETTVSIPLESARDPILSDHSVAKDDPTVEVTAGGFGGGPGQMPHAATTYAAILTLCIIAGYQESRSSASQRALEVLKKSRSPLYGWMASLQDTSTGSFRMHHDGEIDVRASYCLLTVASLLNMLSTVHFLRFLDKTASFVASCQTWEGGFGGEPGAEAHGGYTFCGIAALRIIDRNSAMNVESAADYISRRQLAFEGGFSGRSNKLVDGCYSFWQGGALAIVSTLLNDRNADGFEALFDRAMLERYILLCAQDVHGGLRDKPSKHRDFYHSCYNLSGLSVAQHHGVNATEFGHSTSKLLRTHPCYNILSEKAEFVLGYFSILPNK